MNLIRISLFYLIIGLIIISIDMASFLTADLLDKEEYTSLLDFTAFGLFIMDIPFMMFSYLVFSLLSLPFLILSSLLDLPTVSHKSSWFQEIIFHGCQDVVVYLILVFISHFVLFLPLRAIILKIRADSKTKNKAAHN